MPRSRAEIYLHLVWATRIREPMLTEHMERRVHRCIHTTLVKVGCTVCAIGGLPDHIHLLIQVPPKTSAVQIVKLAKGSSSRMINESAEFTEALYWQEGYGVFSISRSHLKLVTAYVLNQKERHRSGKIWNQWEPTADSASSSGGRPARSAFERVGFNPSFFLHYWTLEDQEDDLCPPPSHDAS